MSGTTGRLAIVAVSFRLAVNFVARHHRHHRPPRGHKCSLGVVDEAGALRGVAILGRPVARMLDDGRTLEVTRVATDGHPNACSALYGAARRAARALGYRRLITYTLATERGTSLRAAGWRRLGKAGGGSWSRPSRRREDAASTAPKVLWEAA